MNRPLLLPGVAMVALLLAACGGGHDAPVARPDTVPASATASPAAFTQYAASLPADDRREPLVVEGLVPPTTEADEPLPLDP